MNGSDRAPTRPDRAPPCSCGRPAGETLQVGLALAELSPDELWLDYAALGGDLSRPAFAAVLGDGGVLSRREFDRAAAALNDAFMARGLGYRIPPYGS